MKPAWRAFKKQVRLGLKFGGAVLRGYPLQYARHRSPPDDPQYCHLWAEFTTPIPQVGSTTVKENRLWNLQLAARYIDGLVLQPQQLFGFWNCVPYPTVKNGFREGPVFVQGRVMTDVGGGLCLIATNLFQALLLSNCEILERHGHSIDPYGDRRFFTLGQDASVAYGYKDLIARNSSQVPLKLRFEVLPEQAVVRSQLSGSIPCPMEVKVESTILEEIPAPQWDGASGWRVQTVRSTRPFSAPHSAQLPVWQVNYRTITLYQPCIGLSSTW